MLQKWRTNQKLSFQGCLGPSALVYWMHFCGRDFDSAQHLFRIILHYINKKIKNVMSSLRHFECKCHSRCLSSSPGFYETKLGICEFWAQPKSQSAEACCGTPMQFVTSSELYLMTGERKTTGTVPFQLELQQVKVTACSKDFSYAIKAFFSHLIETIQFIYTIEMYCPDSVIINF